MKFISKYKFIALLLLLFFSVIIYYTIAVFIARANTPEIVKTALHSKRIKLQLSDFNPSQLQALLLVQDPNFYHHKGYDFTTPGAGKTTISQALVKIYYFKNFKPGFQKIEQTLIARFAFDNLTPKDSILKLFINEVYLGENHGQEIRGFEEAAQYYFKKPFKKLNWEEYLSILAMVRAPATFHILNQKAANSQRVERIKKRIAGTYKPLNNSDCLYDQIP